FFLGANSSQGFVSRFDQLGDPEDSWRCTVIKGGPGTGKSSLMKRLVAAMSDSCSVIEEIYCSSDVNSLDGVIFPDFKLSIADGTPPHALEPQYPGAYESLFSVCDCWDDTKLYQNRKSIMELSSKCANLHKSAASYLYAAGSLITQLEGLADAATDHQKVTRLAASIAEREFPHEVGLRGTERVRFVSGITNNGMLTFEDTIAAVAPRRYILEDNWGAASSLLLSTLRRLALERGLSVITCCCPLFPFTKIDHLLIPALGLGFVTHGKLHPITLGGERTIHARRFTDMEKLKSKKHRMSFLQRAAVNMLEQATLLIGEAKRSHDLMEILYISAMDFAKVDEKSSKLINKFYEMASRTIIK
ncbi:MAG: hypothetical protein RR049_04835, partial [Angelakisella sp.]